MSPSFSNTAGKAELIYQGAQPSLRSWLDLSWFYPIDFHKESLVETSRSLIVIGEQEVVKFRRPGLGATRHFLPFAERWRSSVREILANSEIAPGVYRGLRTFRYQDEELVWCEDEPITDFSLERIPEADEVALSLTRLPVDEFLNIALRPDVADGDRLAALSERLLWFYRTRAAGTDSTLHEQFVSAAIDNMRETLRVLKEEDHVSQEWQQVVLSELRSWSEQTLAECSPELLLRAERGCVREAHGALYAEHICVPLETLAPIILGRSPAQLLGFKRDVLGDLAILLVDFTVAGYVSSAELLVETLQELAPELFAASPSVLNLFFVHTALEEIMKRSSQRTQYLQVAYRTALGLISSGTSRPAVMLFEGNREAEKAKTAWTTSQLIGAEFLGFAGDDAPGDNLGGDGLNETLLEIMANALREQRPVVMECEHCSRELRLQIMELSDRCGAEVFWVRCSKPFEAVGPTTGTHWDQQILQRELSIVPLELSLSPLAAARMVLHEVRRVLNKRPFGRVCN